MIVYGDHSRRRGAGEALAVVMARARALAGEAPGLAWHGACVALLIELGGLLQGVADREAEERGCDDRAPVQQALMAGLLAVAAAIRRSWHSGLTEQRAPDLRDLGALALSGEVVIRRPEGYAFYALYPEAYLEAAAAAPAGSVVVGLRSIGTSLAAIVAEASGATEAFTVRPRGHPFSRQVSVGKGLERLVRDHADRHFVIVDEGPGLSGSSFGGTADWLESLGVQPGKLIFMPSHAGTPGPQASASHRRRWATTPAPVVEVDALLLAETSRLPLARWFIDLTGLPSAPLLDLSGGAWGVDEPAIPTDPGREARKFRLTADRGSFRLKFVGLDDAATAKFARAQALHEAGFAVRPLALRHGFLLEPEVVAPRCRSVPVARLADYLTFRAERFQAGQAGASLAALAAMACANIGEARPDLDLPPLARWASEAAEALQTLCEPVHVDARLHLWEWLDLGGRAVKTDALDHSQAHDLVGCQDIAWDVAGAIIEHGLDDSDAAWLTGRVLGERRHAEELLRLMTLCYLGFQIGWWSFASSPSGQARSGWYAAHAAAFVERLDGAAHFTWRSPERWL